MIEVSEVAPAFGQRGGGLQVRILDSSGRAMSVTALKEQGIIDLTTPGGPPTRRDHLVAPPRTIRVEQRYPE